MLRRLREVACGVAAAPSTLSALALFVPRSFAASSSAHGRTPATLVELQGAWASRDASAARQALFQLSSACAFTTPGMERLGEDARAAQLGLVQSGGWHLLVLLLQVEWDAATRGSLAGRQLLEGVRIECCALLRELSFAVPGFSETLACCPELVERAFALCGQPALFDAACALLEEALPARRTTLRVASLPGLPALLQDLSAPQLATFARVLGLLVYENDDEQAGQEGDSALVRGMAAQAPRFCEANIATLATPLLLTRLVKLLRLRSLAPLATGGVAWRRMQQILAVLPVPPTVQEAIPHLFSLVGARGHAGWDDAALEPALLQPGARLEPAAEAPPPAEEEDREGPPQSPNHHVEVLFLLCALLSGEGKVGVQDAVAQAGFVPAVDGLFDAIDWAAAPPVEHQEGLHGPGCTCDVGTALRMQLLRALHAFIDRDSPNANKRLLLSPDDLALHYTEGEAATATTGSPSASMVAAARRRLTRALSSAAADTPPHPPVTGLMGKLLHRLMVDSGSAPYRFWLCSCAEAFLRGPSAPDQHFAASTGLLQHLLTQVLSHQVGQSPVPLQVSCDLLSEVLKRNQPLFARAEELLDGAHERLTRIVMAHLVDTNVLLRSIALSMEAFSARDMEVQTRMACCECEALPLGCWEERRESTDAAMCSDEQAPPVAEWMGGRRVPEGRLFAWLAHNWLDVVQALMDAVSADEVDGENVSTINTAVVLLTFSRKAGRLPALLAALRARPRLAGDPRPQTCVAFAGLLRQWTQHYFGKAVGRQRDRSSLAFSTGLPFSEWTATAEALCAPPDSASSLLYAGV